MTALDISPREVASGAMRPEHVEAAVEAITNDGFVVLHDVVDTSHLDVLLPRMLEDVTALIERPDAPFNWNTGLSLIHI